MDATRSRFRGDTSNGIRRSLVFKNGVLHDHNSQASSHEENNSAQDGSPTVAGLANVEEPYLYQSTIQPRGGVSSSLANGFNSGCLQDTPYDQSQASNFTRSIPTVMKNRKPGHSSLLSFKEKERRREIDHNNKLLLGQLLKIEKDFVKTK